MKRVKADNRSSAAKSKAAPKTVEQYLASVPEPARSTLKKVRAMIRVGGASEGDGGHQL